MTIIPKTPSIHDVAVSEYRRIHHAVKNTQINVPSSGDAGKSNTAVEISISSMAKSLNQMFRGAK